jgi:serine/threonine protein kinase
MIDFGCAVVQDDNTWDDGIATRNEVTEEKNDRVYSIGTTAYWPPERFSRQETIPKKAGDMWALGVILFIMLTGVHPFDLTGMASDTEIAEHIKNDPSPPITQRLTGHLSLAAINLIEQLLRKDPDERITADQMLQHPWITGEEAATEMIHGSAQKLSRFKGIVPRQSNIVIP